MSCPSVPGTFHVQACPSPPGPNMAPKVNTKTECAAFKASTQAQALLSMERAFEYSSKEEMTEIFKAAAVRGALKAGTQAQALLSIQKALEYSSKQELFDVFEAAEVRVKGSREYCEAALMEARLSAAAGASTSASSSSQPKARPPAQPHSPATPPSSSSPPMEE